jgi:hypothetical protein
MRAMHVCMRLISSLMLPTMRSEQPVNKYYIFAFIDSRTHYRNFSLNNLSRMTTVKIYILERVDNEMELT